MALTTLQAGFTYVGALIATAIVSILPLYGLQTGSALQRRASEEDLLAVGNEFHSAFISYALATPAGQPRTPATLEALLKDARFPDVRRHLRRIYVDPLTRKATWGLIPAPGGQGIMGVYSLAGEVPLKTGNFPLAFEDFDHAVSYAQWKFMAPLHVIETPGATAKRQISQGLPR